MSLKKNIARMEKINSVKNISKNTFARGPTDSVIVDINAYSPSFLPASLIIRVTLSTLITLAIYGPTERAEFVEVLVKVSKMSIILDVTMKQSNLFQLVSKYLHE